MKIRVMLIVVMLIFFTQGCTTINMEEPKLEQKVYSIADFTKIEVGMSYDEILDMMGTPSKSDGFNFKLLLQY